MPRGADRLNVDPQLVVAVAAGVVLAVRLIVGRRLLERIEGRPHLEAIEQRSDISEPDVLAFVARAITYTPLRCATFAF